MESDSSDSSEDFQPRGRKELLSFQGNESSDSVKAQSSSGAKYKQRVLLLTSRGVPSRCRHLVNNLHSLLPHSKKDSKIQKNSSLSVQINQLAELQNTNNCIYLETKRQHSDNFIYFSKTPNGPSAKFQLKNSHTMEELKMTGNCLKGSRPILSFDEEFDQSEHWQIVKELLIHAFAVPRTSRKVKPFIDHTMTFTILDNKIWIRNYQITTPSEGNTDEELVEIGPRLVLDLIRIFDGSFGGSTLFENETYTSPASLRQMAKAQMNAKYMSKVIHKSEKDEYAKVNALKPDPVEDIFR